MIADYAPTPSGVPDAPIRTGATSHPGGTIHPVDPAAVERLRALIAEREALRPRRQKKKHPTTAATSSPTWSSDRRSYRP